MALRGSQRNATSSTSSLLPTTQEVRETILFKLTFFQSLWAEKDLDSETIAAIELLEKKNILKVYKLRETDASSSKTDF